MRSRCRAVCLCELGVMKMADNEAELASVIAHEIGHAAPDTLPVRRPGATSWFPDSAARRHDRWRGLATRETVNAAAPVASLHFSRAFETEADVLGVGYLSQAAMIPKRVSICSNASSRWNIRSRSRL